MFTLDLCLCLYLCFSPLRSRRVIGHVDTSIHQRPELLEQGGPKTCGPCQPAELHGRT